MTEVKQPPKPPSPEFDQYLARVRATERVVAEADLYHRTNRWETGNG